MKKDIKKPMYFNAENFVSLVLAETGLDKAEPEVVEQLSLEIAQTLSDRVTALVVASLGDRELDLLERILLDHPELDKIDALSIITPSIEGLQERILKEVTDLYGEMVESVKLINNHLNK